MYKRLTVYPNGDPIPETLPDSYQPASYGNASIGQNCGTCKYFNIGARYCSAYKATVKPHWWCDGWSPILRATQNSYDPNLVKKITTSIVEEHFTEIPKLKAKQIDYGYTNDYDYENEEDVIKLNVPLMIRMLEYAREDIERDVDLHIIVENLIELSEEGDVLTMKHYPDIIQTESKD